MYYLKESCRIFLVSLLLLFSLCHTASAAEERYDLVYVWDKDLDRVLDYKDTLEQLFDDKTVAKLVLVGRGDEYGVIYDRNGSARSVATDLIHHGEILRKAGLDEAYAIEDKGYHRLYNVSYGIGPNIDALKKTYDRIYYYLGKGVGKDLSIIKVSENNYCLIYRRIGDRSSTSVVARRHAKKLRRQGISTTIIAENNEPVVFGESSLLDESRNEAAVAEVAEDNLPEEKVKQEVEQLLSSSKEVIPVIRDVPKKVVRSFEKSAPGSVIVSRSTASSSFEQQVEDLIKKLRSKGVIAGDETTGWVVYDLEKDTTLLDINANQSFQAASMIKPFVALAFFHQVKHGKLIYGPKSRRNMEAMIQRSNNNATNWIMKAAGGPANVDRILRTNYSHIFKKTEITEYIPAGGRTYKNHALPSDYVRFLRALWNRELPYGKEMRRLMALPGRDRLYYGTPIPQGTLVYNKTGSTAHLCGDMGILAPRDKKGGRFPYAIVGIIERESRPDNYGSWVSSRGKVIRQVSTLVYKELKKTHQLL